MARTAVHFGAGALGRGLVVPELVAAGWSVTVVDPLGALVDALAAASGYGLVIVEEAEETRLPIGIAKALRADDRAAVAEALAGAELVTTAVRKENLGRVVAQVADAWRDVGRPPQTAVVGCENVEHVDALIRDGFARAGMGEHELAGVTIPPTVVDRICASAWPEALEIRTERYTELAVEPPAGWSLPGLQAVPDIDAAFDRKRYLVNTLADASSILGFSKGYRTLAEAMRDAAIRERLAPLVHSLIRHLELRHELSADDLDGYCRQSVARLSNRGIPRQIETVARDIWRKMQPAERFMAPLVDLAARGELDDAAVAVVADLVIAGAAIEGAAMDRRDIADRLLTLAGGDATTRATYEAVAGRIRG